MQEIRTTICGIGIFIPKEVRETLMKLHGEDVINTLPHFLRQFRKGDGEVADLQGDTNDN